MMLFYKGFLYEIQMFIIDGYAEKDYFIFGKNLDVLNFALILTAFFLA